MQDRVLASLDVRVGMLQTSKGLLFAKEFEGAVLLYNTRAIHTFFMRRPIDVALLNGDLEVVALKPYVAPFRLVLPRRGCRHVLELPSGSIERWGLKIGDQLEIRL